VKINSANNRISQDTLFYLAAAGFISILSQIIILRELSVAFFGIELIYILGLGAWLIGTALGAFTFSKSAQSNGRKLQFLFFLSAVLLLIDMGFIRGMRIISGSVPGAFLPFAAQIISLMISILPMSLMSGLLFRYTARRFIDEGGKLAKAYSIESAGSIAGGLAATLLPGLGLRNFTVALICSVAALLVSYFARGRSEWRRWIYSPVSLIFILLFFNSGKIDLWTTSWNYSFILESRDTPYSRITITAPGEQRCVFENDALSYDTEDPSAEEFVQLSTLQKTNPQNVLVLGGGFEGIIDELLKLHVGKIDYVEINRDLIDMMKRDLPAGRQRFLTDERVRIINSDPRAFLKRCGRYEVILICMPEPASVQNNRYYTAEFFKECFARLSDTGIAGFKIRSSENFWRPELLARNRTIFNAAKAAFKDVIVLPGTSNIFIASIGPAETNIDTLIGRFQRRKIAASMVSARYIKYIYTNDRYAEIKGLLSVPGAGINSDYRPVCFALTIGIWLSKFFPELPNSFLSGGGSLFNNAWFYACLVIMTCLAFLCRMSDPLRRSALIFLAGMSGMIAETILLLAYQNENGVLFRDIGLLLTLFMTGLTAGSYITEKLSGDEFVKVFSRLKFILPLSFIILNLITYLSVALRSAGKVPVAAALLMLHGMMVSSFFSFASLNKIRDKQAEALQLYPADLAGGSVGSLAATLVLIPFFGIPAALQLIICAALLSFILN
jgi:spermidine synthase